MDGWTDGQIDVIYFSGRLYPSCRESLYKDKLAIQNYTIYTKNHSIFREQAGRMGRRPRLLGTCDMEKSERKRSSIHSLDKCLHVHQRPSFISIFENIKDIRKFKSV